MRLFAAVFAIAFATISAAAAEPMKLRIQWTTTAVSVITVQTGAPASVKRHYGKSYVIEPIYMAGSSPALTALASNEIDIASLVPQTLVLGVSQAQLDIRAIAQVLSTDVPGWARNEYWVRDDIQKIEDLKGKIVAVNSRGSAVDAVARLMLRRHGMVEARDYQLVEVPFPAMLPALESKKIDLAYFVRPFDLMAAKRPGLKPLFSMGDAVGPAETSFLAAKQEFIAKHRAVLVDFLEDNMLVRRWTKDPATRMEAVKLVSEISKQPLEGLAEWAFTTKDNYNDPHAMLNVPRLQKNINDLHAAGVLPVTIEAAKYVDMSMAQEAAARLGTH